MLLHKSVMHSLIVEYVSLFRCCGELFHAWEMWLSSHLEKPVGSEVGGQDARPWIGSPVGNHACIVPRLL